ncbi:transposable element Tcb1 transposase [Toxorhynchites rutilus septentrionalis]|uniref:transposable element Tcb1 transposase n=1 Tax=Toxorhynchites rutilus septentrionalis TaxID=329112 RepID=UPI002478B758|nr:transposable element Tcb1 transposase [Toxorhynchites rutilus septentrionalis]
MVWRKSGTELQPQNLVPTVKHGGGNQMWGSMVASGPGTMEFIDSTMNKMGYLNILKHNLQAFVDKLGLPRDYWFQKDNDPKHTAFVSPDLNLIEHLWWEVKNRLKNKNPKNKAELRMAIKEIWENFPSSVTINRVESMSRRLQAVLDAKGGHTKY